MTKPIGKLVKSNTHLDYVCQVYGLGEIEATPTPADYAFGSFVRFQLETDPATWMVGLIYDTILLNPEFGWLGPRLSSPTELAVFSPDYLNEKVTLVGMLAIGTMDQHGHGNQEFPQLSATTDTQVETMSESQIRSFHSDNNTLRLNYTPRLLTHGTPMATDLLRVVLQRLQRLEFTPKHHQLINLLLDNLIWQRHIHPFRGD